VEGAGRARKGQRPAKDKENKAAAPSNVPQRGGVEAQGVDLGHDDVIGVVGGQLGRAGQNPHLGQGNERVLTNER
jgi:hypothetical protein